jgi:hypothetical protein
LVANPNGGVFSMTEKVKKAKAPAKPRKTAVKTEAVVKAAKTVRTRKSAMPPREEIEKLARAYWEQRGYQDGFAEQDWLRAEQELLKMAS